MNLNSHYTVEINEEAFIVNSTLTAPKTAVVRYFDKDGDEYFSRKYGVVEPSYIYKKINNGSEVDLSGCYIHGFSLSEYRKKNDIDDVTKVSIQQVNAAGAFFDSSSIIDFSMAIFEKDTNFTDTHFGKGTVSFHKSAFKGLVSFSKAYFGKGDADFQFTDFGNCDVTFEESKFHFGNVIFVNCIFGNGTTNFKKVTFYFARILAFYKFKAIR